MSAPARNPTAAVGQALAGLEAAMERERALGRELRAAQMRVGEWLRYTRLTMTEKASEVATRSVPAHLGDKVARYMNLEDGETWDAEVAGNAARYFQHEASVCGKGGAP